MMQKNVRVLSAASFAEGIAAIIWLALIPTEGKFFSPIRIGLLVGILAVSIVWLFVYFRKGSAIRITQWLVNWRGKFILASLCICLPLLALSAATQQDVWSLYLEGAAFARLLPILVWGSLISIQFGLFLLFPETDGQQLKTSFQPLWKPTVVLLGCFLLIGGFISVTKIGITTDVVGLSWGPPGTPVTFGQVTLVFAFSMCIMVPFWLIFTKRIQRTALLDAIIFFGLWALAVFLWWKEPMIQSHFAPAPMQPNFEYYPHSDAAVFDKSSYQLLFGAGFKTLLVRRPLYVGMLALFHKIAGPGYDGTIFLQILTLALIPALIYLLTTKISNRLAGLLTGGLIVLREANAIHLSRQIAASHAKLMMTDLVTMLGIAAIIYLTVRLLKKREHNPWALAALGACLGLTTLVRAQTLIILAPILMFIIFSQRPIKTGLYESLIVLLGLVMILLPWVWRNWNLTGTFLLDDRGEERLLARNYSTDPTSFPSPVPNETEQEFSARLRKEILTYASTHPADVAFFISNHFFHNMMNSVLYIASIYSTDPPNILLNRVPYWGTWDGKLAAAGGVFLFINLVIFALGIAIAQQRHKSAGWLPFAVFITYSGGNALVRTSGWRFLLPVDWIILMYAGIGLAYLPSRIEAILQQNPDQQKTSSKQGFYLMPAIFALLFLAGASVPIAEQRIPDRNFGSFTNEAGQFLDQKGFLTPAELDTFLQQENSIFVSGIALYPRYFQTNSRLDLADMPEDFNYLHFWLLSKSGEQTILPLRNVPGGIPHTATVTILGCENTNYISAWAVITHSQPKQILMRDPQALLNCPLDEPT